MNKEKKGEFINPKNEQNSAQQNSQKIEVKEDLKKNIKEYFIIFLLLLASFISVFGIYNHYNYNLIDFIAKIENKEEAWANYALLGIFSFTMIFLQSIYWRRKDILSKFSIMLVISIAIAVMLAILFYYIDNFIFPAMSLMIIGMTFYLFDLVFITIGIRGIFFATAIYSIIVIALLKSGIGTSVEMVFTETQVFLSLLLFLGAAYPRLKAVLFQIRTRDNVEFDNGGSGQSSDNDLD